MEREQIRLKLLKLIKKETGIYELPIGNINFNDQLGFDSLDHVELLMVVEEEFDIELDDIEYPTLKDYIDAISTKQANLGISNM